MAASRHRLTPQIINELCKSLRAGVYEHVASELAGVPYRVYREWLNRSRRKKSPVIYRDLDQAVREAKAHARFMAESHMRMKEPKVWLLHGPGKQTIDRPGWSAMPRVNTEHDGGGISQAEMQIIALIHDLLKPHPQLRMEFSEKLSGESNLLKNLAADHLPHNETKL